MIFYPSCIREEGIGPWHLYVQVRALENRIPIAALNMCSKEFGGKSITVDLEHNKNTNITIPRKALASTNEQILVMDIDIENARKIRSKALKKDLYELL